MESKRNSQVHRKTTKILSFMTPKHTCTGCMARATKGCTICVTFNPRDIWRHPHHFFNNWSFRGVKINIESFKDSKVSHGRGSSEISSITRNRCVGNYHGFCIIQSRTYTISKKNNSIFNFIT
ncbi:serum response factor protein A [Trifolium repens]|nr:serum response factor protein A [Trifolium repens]